VETHKRYLGDGVYVCAENGMVKLTTENGISHDQYDLLGAGGLVCLRRVDEPIQGNEKRMNIHTPYETVPALGTKWGVGQMESWG